MTSALIGHTGFVGSNLLRQGQFDELFRSSDIHEIAGCSFDRVVCAGAAGAKWIANEKPEDDLENIKRLIDCLCDVEAGMFTLISTVDVLGDTPYGYNRLRLENFVRAGFDNHRIVRLPALFGPGMKKNVLYDLMYGHRLDEINTESTYQWYPLRRLTEDLAKIDAADVRLVNLVSEPIANWRIRDRLFPNVIIGGPKAPEVHYDQRCDNAAIWHGERFAGMKYIIGREEILDEMESFLLEELLNGRQDDQGLLATADQGSRA